MPAFHLLRCQVDIGNDHSTTVYRDRSRPIAFPELPILQFLHGEEAVTDIAVVGQWNAPNQEVLERLQQIYTPEVVQAVFPGARPMLPLGDPSVPKCTMPVYKPRPTRPESPDPKLRQLDQFTAASDAPLVEAPPLPDEDDPTPDELAAHAQDEPDEDELGLSAGPPNPGDLPHSIHDPGGKGSSRRALASRAPSTLPDVNAGSSHGPDFDKYTDGRRK